MSHQPTTPYPRFHLALPVIDLEETFAFYRDVLGCAVGRQDARWIDLDFYGHQLVLHLVEKDEHPAMATNTVDSHAVPAGHFGPILDWDDFDRLAEHLRSQGVEFVIEPYTRFAGQRGEQATLFIQDPSGNHLEFKAFKDIQMLFATELDEPVE